MFNQKLNEHYESCRFSNIFLISLRVEPERDLLCMIKSSFEPLKYLNITIYIWICIDKT